MADSASRDDDRLIGRWIDGERSTTLQRQLEERLLDDPAFRRRYQLSVATEQQLRGLRQRRARASLRLPGRSASGHRSPSVVGTVAAGLAAVLALGIWLWPDTPPTPAGAAVSDPTVVLDRYQAVPDGSSRTIALQQGGNVILQGGSRYRLAGTVDDVRLDLAAGQATVSVVPDRGTRLRVITRETTVSVLGTRFAVTATDSGSAIRVHEGRVQVTPRGGDQDRILTSGEGWSVAALSRIASDPSRHLQHQNRLVQAQLWAGEQPYQQRLGSLDGYLADQDGAATVSWCATPDLEPGSYRLTWPDTGWSAALPRRDLQAAAGTSLDWRIDPDGPGSGPIVFRGRAGDLRRGPVPYLVRTDASADGTFRRRPAVLAVPGATVSASRWIDRRGRFDARPLEQMLAIDQDARPLQELIDLCRQWPVELELAIATDRSSLADWQPVLQRLERDLPARTRLLVILGSGEHLRQCPPPAVLASWIPGLRRFISGGPDRLQSFVPLTRAIDFDRWLPVLTTLPADQRPDGVLVEAMHAYLTDTPAVDLDHIIADLERRLPGLLRRLDERGQAIRAAGFLPGTQRTGLAVWPHEHAAELQGELNRSPAAQQQLARLLDHLRQQDWALIRSGGYNPLLDKVLKELAEN